MNATAKFTRPVRPGTEWNGFTCTERAFFMSNLSVHSYISSEAMEKKHKTKSKKYRSGGNVGHLHCLQQKVINFNTPMRKPIISTI